MKYSIKDRNCLICNPPLSPLKLRGDEGELSLRLK